MENKRMAEKVVEETAEKRTTPEAKKRGRRRKT